jgi:hypothetical protein
MVELAKMAKKRDVARVVARDVVAMGVELETYVQLETFQN